MTDLSIVIVSYKGWDRLVKCLEALDSFSGKSFSFEVIVVDNMSGEDTIFAIEKRFSKFIFIHNSINGGYANGCNRGASIAKGSYILLLNPDTVAAESEIFRMIEVSRNNPQYGLVSCRQVNERGKESVATGVFPAFFNLTGLQRAFLRSLKKKEPLAEAGTSFPDWVSGSVMLLSMETFRQVGGLDEDFWMYFEDVDLCRRIRDINLEIAFCTEIKIEHNHGGSSRINLNTASLTKTEVHISRHIYISKHKSGVEKICIQLFLVLNTLITNGLIGIPGIVLFFIPKIFIRTLIFGSLISYYASSLSRLSWISPRSVNFQN